MWCVARVTFLVIIMTGAGDSGLMFIIYQLFRPFLFRRLGVPSFYRAFRGHVVLCVWFSVRVCVMRNIELSWF